MQASSSKIGQVLGGRLEQKLREQESETLPPIQDRSGTALMLEQWKHFSSGLQ